MLSISCHNQFAAMPLKKLAIRTKFDIFQHYFYRSATGEKLQRGCLK
jgi:hypothetical protein